ncbi:MAG: ABC transporter ATP-binding protein [Bacillota bacterium]|nr:ABC transporter ATP-binding protein [Bacillota bacterium]HHU43468.1 ABC transporter ATP-binding protein [Clostridiales bacterium]
MFKLLKVLKPYRGLIVLIIIMVAGVSLATLYLPDRMSRIIAEGIVVEVEYEKTPDGEIIYVFDETSQFEAPLPKLIYENEGKLVTQYIDGKHYAVIIGVEMDNGEVIKFINPETGDVMPVPMFLRTVDGLKDSPPKQGKLVLDKNGSPQVKLIQKSDLSIIFRNGLIMLGVTLASSILSIFIALYSSKVGMAFGRDIRKNLFEKAISLSKAQEDSFSTASLITRTTNDVTQLQNLIIMALRMVINVPIMLVGGLIMAIRKDAQMTIVLLFTIPIVTLTILLIAKNVIPIFKAIQKKLDRLTMIARENITGIRVIRAFGGDDYEDNRFEKANRELTQSSLKAARIMSILMPFMTIIMSGTSVAIVFIGAFAVNRNLSNNLLDYTYLGNMMAVAQYIIQIMISVIMLSVIFIIVPRASVSAVRIQEVLDTQADIFSPPNPVSPPRKGMVEFESVYFSYSKTSKEYVLKDISFFAKKGSVTAVIGGTGSGKSTLISLIPRLYDVTKGKVKVDEIDVRDYSLNDLRSRIGFVTQKAALFSGDIKENILYGAEDDKNFENAIKISQSKNIIEEKQGGIEAIVEQAGRNLSGGQKQRISIARALAKDHDILILDDSFSALDFATDAKIRRELKEIIKDKTVIIVAQRIGTVMDADTIVVLDEGRLVGIGRHHDLIKTCPEYRDIALSQMSEEELGLKGGL